MSFTAVLHSEWIKVKSLRGPAGSLLAVLLATLGVTALAFATIGQAEADNRGAEPLYDAFYALNFGQVAAIAFGATAVSSEYLNGALRVSLAAVPRRTCFYAAKIAVIGGLALATGLVTAFAAFLLGQSFMGSYAIGLDHRGGNDRTCMNEERDGSTYLGRDHHPHCFSIWMAGGGVKGGITHGATDEFGYYVAEDKVTMPDFHATTLNLLGLAHTRLTSRHAGRDFRLTDVSGDVVNAILST